MLPASCEASEPRGRLLPLAAGMPRNLPTNMSALRPCAFSRAAPQPILRLRAKSRCHRIIFHVSNESGFLRIVANPVIVRFLLPEMFADAVQQLVRLGSRVGFPTPQNAAQR